jgi:flagellar protein FlaG
MQSYARNLQFSVDGSSGKTVVRVVDMETGNVIRQIPSQEALDIARAVDRLQGLLLRQQA